LIGADCANQGAVAPITSAPKKRISLTVTPSFFKRALWLGAVVPKGTGLDRALISIGSGFPDEHGHLQTIKEIDS
jgi:hypothetical protein